MQKGIILSNISDLYKVESENKIYDCNARGKFKNKISPVAGDMVEIEITDDQNCKGVINEIYERKNYLKRPKMANLSQIILVVSMRLPKPDLELLDKQIVYAETLKIKPIICLNKIDLLKKQKDNKGLEELKQIHSIYENIGYTVIETEAKNNIGVNKIKELLKDNITAFSGNSGVGKSTLINALLGEDITQEGLISTKNKRGKNTTTQVKLYKIEENTYIADTPGFSTFDINEIPKNDLAYYFIEFRDYINKCEYADCSHIKEGNCGIKNAVEQGKISIARYERFCDLYSKIKENIKK